MTLAGPIILGCAPDAGLSLATRSCISTGAAPSDPNYGDSAQYSIIGIWHVKAYAKMAFYQNGYAVGMSSATHLFQPSITALYIPGTPSQ